MKRIQKNWLWVSLVMFLVPEIFFSFIPTFFSFLLGHGNFPSIATKIFPNNFLDSNPIIVDLFLGIEYLGLVSLFIFNIKFSPKAYKWVMAVFLGLILIVLSLVIILIYSVTHLSFP